ncbi:hypothetical protein [Pontibacter harenae]|uniref:hypothetical protein n=1 Tax=Pontibacter harenae TaxID=2894083 RepID=UPI001E3D6E53|nr:hypothetical protein [Pontibacter harenae]MCC9168691.1 hypothetical protein [Pontibacter harenae]
MLAQWLKPPQTAVPLIIKMELLSPIIFDNTNRMLVAKQISVSSADNRSGIVLGRSLTKLHMGNKMTKDLSKESPIFTMQSSIKICVENVEVINKKFWDICFEIVGHNPDKEFEVLRADFMTLKDMVMKHFTKHPELRAHLGRYN